MSWRRELITNYRNMFNHASLRGTYKNLSFLRCLCRSVEQFMRTSQWVLNEQLEVEWFPQTSSISAILTTPEADEVQTLTRFIGSCCLIEVYPQSSLENLHSESSVRENCKEWACSSFSSFPFESYVRNIRLVPPRERFYHRGNLFAKNVNFTLFIARSGLL